VVSISWGSLFVCPRIDHPRFSPGSGQLWRTQMATAPNASYHPFPVLGTVWQPEPRKRPIPKLRPNGVDAHWPMIPWESGVARCRSPLLSRRSTAQAQPPMPGAQARSDAGTPPCRAGLRVQDFWRPRVGGSRQQDTPADKHVNCEESNEHLFLMFLAFY
jgi:hypothetical protein